MQGNESEKKQTTVKQDVFINALLAGNSIVVSSQIAGCGEKTAHAWLKLDHVQSAYQQAKNRIFEDAISGLMTDVQDACFTLKSIMKDSEVSASVRVRAAQIILEQSLAIHKFSTLEQKVAELEALIGQRL